MHAQVRLKFLPEVHLITYNYIVPPKSISQAFIQSIRIMLMLVYMIITYKFRKNCALAITT
jgi:hypothetical protein